MRWQGRQRSSNVEDRRGRRPTRVAFGGGGIAAIIIVLVAILLGADPRAVIGLVGQQPAGPAVNAPPAGGVNAPPAGGLDDQSSEFIAVVLKDTENVWTKLFQQQVQGARYTPPRLIIYSSTDRSGCGIANAEMGPFYCPADQQIYIDPAFFDEMTERLGAPGDFAQAYVIAHEVAHHVQRLLGFSEVVDRIRAQGDTLASNRASVRLELQADYLAGVWAHHADRDYQILEAGDIGEAINAANQIGDDKLQRMSQGFVVPARYTHGTSAQRVRWFKAGLVSGDLEASRELFERDYSDL